MDNNTTADTTLRPQSTSSFDRYISIIFWAMLGVMLAVYCSKALNDPDFWWHLKSGEVMLNTGSLIDRDPFNFTGDTVVHSREEVILKGYWLWQVTAGLLYRMWGFYGIFILKAFTLLLLMGTILREMRRQTITPFVQMALTGIGSLILVTVFALERPQMFSFIFVTLLLGMIAHIRQGGQPSWIMLPMMALWANLHGGFVLGDILLALFATGTVIQYRNDPARLKLLLCWAAAGTIASFANPNGWNALLEAFSLNQHNIIKEVNEYKSSWVHFKENKLIGLLWGLTAFHIAGMFFSRKTFWPEIFISAFVIYFGLKHLRNEGFIALSLLPMTGWYLDQAATRLGFRWLRIWQTAALIALSVLFVQQTGLELTNRKNGWPVAESYPVKMALFLRDSGMSGHLFNEYGRGGYFNWVLYPKWQTFIDGRGLDLRVYDQSNLILLAGKNYDALLELYKIDAVALQIRIDAHPQPLLKQLLNNPNWTPVYLDKRFFVLARNSDKNSAVIRNFKIDKKGFLNSILYMYSGYAILSPDDLEISSCYAQLLIYAGNYPEAEVMLSKLERIPGGKELAPALRQQIYTLKEQQVTPKARDKGLPGDL